MAIVQLVDKVTNAVEQNETTMGIFLDLSKAFETIDHNILLYKLKHYGFRGIVLDWFKNYLSNRKQFVSFDTSESEQKILYVVCLRDPFWVPYFSFFLLMILLIGLMYLILFFLLMTPLFFTHTPTLKNEGTE